MGFKLRLTYPSGYDSWGWPMGKAGARAPMPLPWVRVELDVSEGLKKALEDSLAIDRRWGKHAVGNRPILRLRQVVERTLSCIVKNAVRDGRMQAVEIVLVGAFPDLTTMIPLDSLSHAR